jgi:hypothetical protein
MASEEELLVTREEYEKVREGFIKEAKDRRRLFLVKNGADETWVRGLTDDEVIHHALVLKKVIKERLPFKSVEVRPMGEKGPLVSSGDSDIAVLVKMMAMQMEQSKIELKAKEAKEEREYKARETRDALALEQAKADAKARDSRDEQARADSKALLLQLQVDHLKVVLRGVEKLID